MKAVRDEDDDSERTMVRRPAPAAREMALEHVLLLRQEAGPPRRIAVSRDLRVGRSPSNDLVLNSPEISRAHCALALHGSEVVVTDLGSTNGVYLDGRRVEGRAALVPGVRIALGPFMLHYQRGSPAELAAAEAREQEEAQAVAYIQALLPRPMADGPVTAEWHFQPSAQLGGDAFGYRWLDADRFAIFLLDVSGHGIGSALLAASAIDFLRNAGDGTAAQDPAVVLARANAAYPMEQHNGLFFSLWYGVYDRSRRALRYGSAGHHPAYLIGPDGAAPLATRAPAIGMSDRARFAEAELVVPPAACLYLFSDGLFEVVLPDGRDGAIADLLPALSDRAAPGDIVQHMRTLAAHRPFEDDVSMLRLTFA